MENDRALGEYCMTCTLYYAKSAVHVLNIFVIH